MNSTKEIEINNDNNEKYEYITFENLEDVEVNNNGYKEEWISYFNDKNDWKNYSNGINVLRSINKFRREYNKELLNEFINEIITAVNSIRSYLCKLTLILMKEIFDNFNEELEFFIKIMEPILIHKILNVMKFIKIEVFNCYESLVSHCFSDTLINLIIKNCSNSLITIRDFSLKNLLKILAKNDINKLMDETWEKIFLNIYNLEKLKKIKKLEFINLVKNLKNQLNLEKLKQILESISVKEKIIYKNLEFTFINLENKENKNEKISFKNFRNNQRANKLIKNFTLPVDFNKN